MKKENREILHGLLDLIEHSENLEVKYLKALDERPRESDTGRIVKENALEFYFERRIKPYYIPSVYVNEEGTPEAFENWVKKLADAITVPDNLSKRDILTFFEKEFREIYKSRLDDLNADEQE